MQEKQQRRDIVPDGSPTLYFVDGFHGGIKGHMPKGSLADILHGLETNPDWRVTLEVEPVSFDFLKKQEPDTFYRLKAVLEADYDDPRAEIASGSYAQPFAWAIGGESNIRHLLRGMTLVHDSFPGAVVDTYAVQEPCWTSALPQILVSLGFKRVVLKNSTCWCGYTAGHDAETCLWVGPDGSRIAAVPRYGCEDLIFCWAIEGSGFDKAALDHYAQKCLDNGIQHPVGVCFQDLGWKGEPWINEKYQHFTTWRQYIDHIADRPTEEWRFSQEDILVTLPWGQRTLQKLTEQVRAAENKLLSAEKMASMARIAAGAAYPQKKLNDAWDQLLLSQHHDAWICATCGSWAAKADFQTSTVQMLSDEVIHDAAFDVSGEDVAPHAAGSRRFVRVFNTLGRPRSALADIAVTLPHGMQHIALRDEAGRTVPLQCHVTRRYHDDHSINACHLTFAAQVPAFGFATYEIVPAAEEVVPEGAHAVIEGETLRMETDQYSIALDLAHGGVFTSLFDKALGREIAAQDGESAFNEYKGYFIDDQAFFSTRDCPVRAKITENGPLRVRAEVEGHLNHQFFKIYFTLEQGSRRIGLHPFFYFQPNTWIGHPWEMPPERGNLEHKKSNHDDRYKLHALFPTAFGNGKIYKDAAFDVCESRHEDTFFLGWDKIKHNILVHWVDHYNAEADLGLALFCNHTTSYLHGAEHPLGLTLAWGWQGGFWWGRCPLGGAQELSYWLAPHAGRWDKAALSEENAALSEPLLAREFSADAPAHWTRSFLQLDTPGFELTACMAADGWKTTDGAPVEGCDVLARVFNAEADGTECRLEVGFPFSSVTLVQPDGTPAEGKLLRDGNCILLQEVPRFGLRTLKFTL